MKKLISMTDFVLEQKIEYPLFKESAIKIKEYANFLKQPLTLGFFVPCDEDGNVLEEPIYKEYSNCDELDVYDNLVIQHQQAQERVIFEGFWVDRTKKPLTIIRSDANMNDFLKEILNNAKIEDLVPYNLTIK